jgi:hypothetical protein
MLIRVQRTQKLERWRLPAFTRFASGSYRACRGPNPTQVFVPGPRGVPLNYDQSGLTLAFFCPHFEHRMRGPKLGTGGSQG